MHREINFEFPTSIKQVLVSMLIEKIGNKMPLFLGYTFVGLNILDTHKIVKIQSKFSTK